MRPLLSCLKFFMIEAEKQQKNLTDATPVGNISTYLDMVI